MNRLCGVRLHCESSNAKEEEFWASAPLRLHVPAHRQSSSRPAALAAHPGTITREMSEQEWIDALSEEMHVDLRKLRELSRFGRIPDQVCVLCCLP